MMGIQWDTGGAPLLLCRTPDGSDKEGCEGPEGFGPKALDKAQPSSSPLPIAQPQNPKTP